MHEWCDFTSRTSVLGRTPGVVRHAARLTSILHGDLLQVVVVALEAWLFVLHRQGRRVTVAAGEVSPLGWVSVVVERPCSDRAQEQQTRGQNIP